MALEQAFRRFYTVNPVVTKLRFGIPGAPEISPDGFRLLAECIVARDEPDAPTRLRHSMRIRTDPAFISNGNEAEYFFQATDRVPADTMLLKTPDIFETYFGRAVAYHESIHALLDACGRDIRRRDNEGLAFLGEALFYLECGFDGGNPPPGLSAEKTGTYNLLADIFPIAAAIRARAEASGNAMMATQAEVAQLRGIMAGLGIRGNFTDLNGVRGRRIRSGAWH